MGSVLGIVARQDGILLTKSPLYAEEEASFSLSNIFTQLDTFVDGVLEKSDLDQQASAHLNLLEEERQALGWNHILDWASDAMETFEAMEEEPPQDFYAIDFSDDEEEGGLIYNPDLARYENWSEASILASALEKMQAILQEWIRQTQSLEGDISEQKENLWNLEKLIEHVNGLRLQHPLATVALVLAPY